VLGWQKNLRRLVTSYRNDKAYFIVVREQVARAGAEGALSLAIQKERGKHTVATTPRRAREGVRACSLNASRLEVM
jgi:hypothetical protein